LTRYVKSIRIKNGKRIVDPVKIIDTSEPEPTLIIPTPTEKIFLNAIDFFLERYNKNKSTQGHWVNLDRKIAVIPIMRCASSSIDAVLSKHSDWKKFNNRECSKDYKFFTVWRDPYVRFISALSRELSDICDEHKGNEKEIIHKTVTAWSDNPDLILDLDHTISQTEYCRQVMPNHARITIFKIDKIKTMLSNLITGPGKHVVMPHLNPSVDYQLDIKKFFDSEKNFMKKWCEQKYKEDYDVWERLLNSDTLSIIEEY